MLEKMKPIAFLLVLLALSSGMARADLIAHWSLDEGAGNTVADSTGNGYGGTFEGNPEWVEGLYGQALRFAGAPDRVVVPYSPGLNPEEAFTVIAWSNVAVGSSGWRSPITSRDDGPQRGYIIYAGLNLEFRGGHAASSQWGSSSRIFFAAGLRTGLRESRATQSSRRKAPSMSMKEGLSLCRYHGASFRTLATSS